MLLHPFLNNGGVCMEWIKIGALIKPFGLKGEMKVFSMTDFSEIRFRKGNTIYLEIDNEMTAFKIASFKVHKNQPIISFEKHLDINLIEKYSKKELFIKKEDLHHLNKDEYYVFELKGLTVVDQNNTNIGTVIDVEPTGAHSILRIKTADKDVLIPYVPSFIKDVNLNENKIIVNVIEGLL